MHSFKYPLNFIEPSLNSTQEAVTSSPGPSNPSLDYRLVNSLSQNTFPISSHLVYEDRSIFVEITNPTLDQTKAKVLVDFISWAITDGQKSASAAISMGL